ncbi:MAG: hypothetical protein ACXVCY_07730 [Pseudobdellovibrionaceae bacterium]
MGFKTLQEEAILLTKKFGFLPRSVVWDFYCPPGKSVRYKNWSDLSKSQLFSPYVIGTGLPEYLIFSSQGKRLVGEDAVTAAAPVYLSHDEIVMRFYLHLQLLNCTERSLSEGELKMDRALALKSMGDGVISKLPDLLFDIKTQDGFIRCALEIEKTRKSQGRYKTMRRSYQRARNIDLILFGVASDKIEGTLKKELFDNGKVLFGKEVGFFDLDDFSDRKLDASLRIGGKEVSIKNLLLSLAENIPDETENLRKVSA